MRTDTDAIKAAFNSAADYFDDPRLTFWDYFGRRAVMLARVAPGQRVLDVCCGSGASALPAGEAAGSSGEVVGVDVAASLLELARAKACERGLDWVHLVEGDVASLEFLPVAFDVVLCVFGIFFAPDMAPALAGLWEKVRPGGTLVVTTWGRRFLDPGHKHFLDVVQAIRPDLVAGVPPGQRLTTREGLRELFAEAEVTTPEITEDTYCFSATIDDLWVMLSGSGPRRIINQLTPGESLAVRNQLAGRLGRSGREALVADALHARAVKSG